MERTELARVFVKTLSRAPLIPMALATPAAIVVEASELGIAHAGGGEGDCIIKVEAYNPRAAVSDNIMGSVINRNVPCDARLDISLNIAERYVSKLNIRGVDETNINDLYDWATAIGIGGFLAISAIMSGVALRRRISDSVQRRSSNTR